MSYLSLCNKETDKLTMAECLQKSTSDSIKMFVVNSKVYYYARDPDTSLHGREKRTDLQEEEFYAVPVQESDPTVSLRKDKSEMAENYPKNSF